MRLLPRAARGRVAVQSLFSVLLFATSAAAQQSVGAIAGTVKDSAGTPIVNVEVRAIGRAWATRTDTAGAFRLSALPVGDVELRFRRLGFEPETLKTSVSSGGATHLDVVLQPVPQELAALVVESEIRARELLWQFYQRKEQGYGHFITREQIEKRHPSYMSDMMRMVPGTVLMPNQIGGSSVLRFARAMGGRDCPPQYFIDGVMVRGFNIDDIPPGDVEGIEIYSGVATIPSEFKSRTGTSICGVIAIWSRLPGT
jgi:iron complex outermembrane receptor protein